MPSSFSAAAAAKLVTCLELNLMKYTLHYNAHSQIDIDMHIHSKTIAIDSWTINKGNQIFPFVLLPSSVYYFFPFFVINYLPFFQSSFINQYMKTGIN